MIILLSIEDKVEEKLVRVKGSKIVLNAIENTENFSHHSSSSYTCFQWTEDGQSFQIQYLTLDTWPGSIESQVLDYKVLSIRVKYQESSIGFENLAYLQSIDNKCKPNRATDRIDHSSRTLDSISSRGTDSLSRTWVIDLQISGNNSVVTVRKSLHFLVQNM